MAGSPVSPATGETTTPRRRKRGRPPIADLEENRRSQIIAAAVTVFAEYGYEATTMSAIARHAGIGQGTLYRYVSSKRELLDLVFDYSVEHLLQVAQTEALTAAAPTTATELLDRVGEVLTSVETALDREPELLSLVLVEASAIDEELKLRILGLEATIASLVVGVFAQAQDSGLLREGADPEVCGLLATKLLLPAGLRAVMGQRDPALRARYRATLADFARHAFLADRDAP